MVSHGYNAPIFKLNFSALKLAITHGDHLVCKEGEQSPKLKIEVNHASFC